MIFFFRISPDSYIDSSSRMFLPFYADISRLGGLKWTSSHAPLFSLIRFVEALGVSLVSFASRTSFALVGSSGLEPPTSCLSGTRSNLLSYEPMSFSEAFSLPVFGLVEMKGIEPLTPCLQGRCSPS